MLMDIGVWLIVDFLFCTDAQMWIYGVTAQAVRMVMFIMGALILLLVLYVLYRLLACYCLQKLALTRTNCLQKQCAGSYGTLEKLSDTFESSEKVSEKSEYSV